MAGKKRILGRKWAAAHFGDDAFRPPRSSDLRLWLQAHDLALAGGAAVIDWFDKSGNNIVITQGTAANRPTYQGNVVNGRPVVRFDGVDDFMEDGGAVPLTYDFGDRYTTFSVFKCDSTGGLTQAVFDVHNDAATNTRFQLLPGSAMFWRGVDSLGVQAVTSGADPRDNIFRAHGGFCNGAQLQYFINRTRIGVATYTPPNSQAAVGISLGTLKATPAYAFKGDLAELMIYGRYLQEGELEKIWNYLGRKYALGYD